MYKITGLSQSSKLLYFVTFAKGSYTIVFAISILLT